MIAHNFDSEGNLIKQSELLEEEENDDDETNDELVGEEKDNNESKEDELTALIKKINNDNNSDTNFISDYSSESVEYVFLVEQKSYEYKSE